MRKAIRDKLIQEISAVGDRVYEPHAAEADTIKPYVVISQGVDTPDTPWTGFRRVIEVWPNISRTTFESVDALVQNIVDVLSSEPLATGSGEVFTCIYIGPSGPDVVNEDWDIITRGLRFAVLALQPVAVAETLNNDPWVDSLASWTQQLLGEDWKIYKNFWPLGYTKPSVLWRVATVDVQGQTRAAFKVQKKLVGHVLGGTPNEQIAGALSIVQGLVADIKIPLDIANKRYLTVLNPRADYKADALTAGQITASFSTITMRPQPEVPLVGRVGLRDPIKEKPKRR